MKKQPPKRIPLPRGLLLLAAGCLLLTACALLLLARPKPALTVNGATITAEHEQVYLDDARSAVTAYYYTKYGADVNEAGFWQRQFDGQTPEAYQRTLARTRLVRDTVERQLAREHGTKTSVTMAEIAEEMAARNGDGGVKYGPEQYAALEYIAQTQSVARDALKTALLQGELAPTEDDLRALYTEENGGLFDSGYSAVVGVFSYGTLQVGHYPQALADAFAAAERLWRGGKQPVEILEAVAQETGVTLTYEAVTLDTAALQKDSELLPVLAASCREIPPAGFSEPWEIGVTRGVAVVLEKEDRGRADFASARGTLTKLWINSAYETYLDRAVAAAAVQ